MENIFQGIKIVFEKNDILDGNYFKLKFKNEKVPIQYLFDENIYPMTHTHNYRDNIEGDFINYLIKMFDEIGCIDSFKGIPYLNKKFSLYPNHSGYSRFYSNTNYIFDLNNFSSSINDSFLFSTKDITYTQIISDIKEKIRQGWKDRQKNYIPKLLTGQFNEIRNFVKSVSPKKVLRNRGDITVENLCSDLSVDDFSDKEDRLLRILFGYNGVCVADKDIISENFLNKDGFLKLNKPIDKISLTEKDTRTEYFGVRKGKCFYFRPKIIEYDKRKIENFKKIKVSIKNKKYENEKICFNLSVDEISNLSDNFLILFPWIFNESKFFEEDNEIQINKKINNNLSEKSDTIRIFSNYKKCDVEAFTLNSRIINSRTGAITKDRLKLIINELHVKYNGNSRKDELIKILAKSLIIRAHDLEEFLKEFFTNNKFFVVNHLSSIKSSSLIKKINEEAFKEKIDNELQEVDLNNITFSKILLFYIKKHLRGGIIVDPLYTNNTSTDEVLMNHILNKSNMGKMLLRIKK